MGSSIAAASWFCVHILTQNVTMKTKAAAEQDIIFFFPKMIPCPSRMFQCSLLTRLLNSSCPPLQKQNWGHFFYIPRNGSNEKHTRVNEMA